MNQAYRPSVDVKLLAKPDWCFILAYHRKQCGRDFLPVITRMNCMGSDG